jgi:hypothetical protein
MKTWIYRHHIFDYSSAILAPRAVSPTGRPFSMALHDGQECFTSFFTLLLFFLYRTLGLVQSKVPSPAPYSTLSMTQHLGWRESPGRSPYSNHKKRS